MHSLENPEVEGGGAEVAAALLAPNERFAGLPPNLHPNRYIEHDCAYRDPVSGLALNEGILKLEKLFLAAASSFSCSSAVSLLPEATVSGAGAAALVLVKLSNTHARSFRAAEQCELHVPSK